jgi:hypothetical protein
MRPIRITFLMLAAIGGCTPLVIERRYTDDSSAPTPAYHGPAVPGPTPAQWAPPPVSELPAPAVRFEDQAMLTATTNPDGTVKSSVTTAKLPLQVAQLPAIPLPAGSTATDKGPPDQVDRYLDKTKVAPASFVETRTEKPGSFVDRADLDAKTPAASVVDLGGTPMVQQPAFRMVNTKKFTLNYEVKDVGVTGISRVDLWCTQDMRTWKRVESVQQLANALLVEMKDEGIYGFTLVAQNGNGLGKAPPQQGELPQVWVSVNTTPPAVTLAGVEMSLTNKTPSLIIRWTAKDRNFGPRPLTLSYASSPDGPWTLMATNVENSGRFEWPLPAAHVPSGMYVRVQAADLNGNVGYAQTESPIHLDVYTAKAEPPPEPARPATPPPPSVDPARPSVTNITVEPNQQ